MKLREISIQDAKRITKLVCDESISKWTSTIPFPYDEQDAIDWINRTSKSSEHNPFAVEVNNEIVGCVSFWRYDDKSVEIGYWVGKDYWGNGICTKALKLLLSTSNIPDGYSIVAKIMAGNIASERVLEKCGFSFFKKCIVTKNGKDIDGKLFIKQTAT